MQGSLDTLLAPSLRSTIEKNLGEKTLIKIEQRLVERHGITMIQAIKDFHKFDSVLREFFGAGADGLEAQFLQSVINFQKGDEIGKEWITVKDEELVRVFLEAIGDDDKKAIINAVMDEPLIISDIITKCKIPQTSGYRKLNSLINAGILITNGFTITRDGKRVSKYETFFENIKIEIEKNKMVVKIQPKKESIDNSIILQIINVR